MVDAIEPRPDEVFIEIGPGRGALTRPLAARVGRLLAVELDRDLAVALPAAVPANVTVVQGDFLSIDLAALLGDTPRPVRVAGNLPYNVASPMLFALLAAADEGRRLGDATLMLQKEVADRVVARPGEADYGALSIQVAWRASARRVLVLPPGAFRPAPKVTSALVTLRFGPAAVDVGDPATFERLVRGAFFHRRKTILNALQPVAASFGREPSELLERTGLDPRRRPEELSLQDFARLGRCLGWLDE